MTNGEGDDWCLIESDPGVFNELISGFGVSGVQVEELLSLDEEFFDQLKPMLGLIFLFTWNGNGEIQGNYVPDAPNVFFTRQTVQNACATQAIINLLMNIEDEGVKLGPDLENLKSFTDGFDPLARGMALAGYEKVRSVHNSFAREDFMEMPTVEDATGDAFHFVAYVPVGGAVYELDGLHEAPIKVAEFPRGSDWTQAVKGIISDRINKYSATELRFNLMAVIPDRKLKSENRLAELTSSGMESEEVGLEIGQLQMTIAEEDQKRALYRVENNRRRHNYFPFIVQLLKILAREGKLVPLIEKDIESAKAKKAAKGEQK